MGEVDHPLVNQKDAPDITALNNFFKEEGVRLSVNACKKAIEEWGGDLSEITHVVSTTCTNSANPGFDHFVVKELGVNPSIEKILLHGVGCSGGLAAIRAACNLALGSSYQRKPARILVLACEISSLLVRSELDSINKEQKTRIGVCLFSDCASACVLSNGVGPEPFGGKAAFDLLGWEHKIIEDTENDLGFDVDPLGEQGHSARYDTSTDKILGWKVVLTPRVPSVAAAAVSPVFESLIGSIPSLHNTSTKPVSAADFDWALHPGGSTIITGVQSAMDLTEEHLRASYEIYVNYGNSSSATIMAVMNQLRNMGEGRENVVACAFGPGIALEMMIMRRSKDGESEVHAPVNGFAMGNGHSTIDSQAPMNGLAATNGYASANGTTEVNGHAAEPDIRPQSVQETARNLPVPDVD